MHSLQTIPEENIACTGPCTSCTCHPFYYLKVACDQIFLDNESKKREKSSSRGAEHVHIANRPVDITLLMRH